MATVIVDGYNVVHAWPALERILRERSLEDARRALVQMLAEYAAQSGDRVTVVFDAHSREERGEPVQTVDGVTVRYGTRRASADHVIERLASQAARRGDAGDVIVATGDRLQRTMVSSMGVAVVSAKAFGEEVQRMASASKTHVHRAHPAQSRRIEHLVDAAVLRRLEAIRRGRAT
jgi:predicted RNA-binding protein with PIN domain